MGENVKKWYVLRAIGGKENKVKEYIESEISRLNLARLYIPGAYPHGESIPDKAG